MKRLLILLAAVVVASCTYPRLPSVRPAALVVERALGSVVHMRGETVTEEGQPTPYGCTAFSIATRKFLTAAHCIGTNMVIDGHPAMTVFANPALDLAVIVADYVRPPLYIRARPLTRQEDTTGLGYGYSWQFPTITHHKVIILNFSPYLTARPEVWFDQGRQVSMVDPDVIAPGTWFSTGFIGGMSGGPVIDAWGDVVGVVQRGNALVAYGVDSVTIWSFLTSPELTANP